MKSLLHTPPYLSWAAASAAACLLLLACDRGRDPSPPPDPRAEQIHRQAIVIDGHNDVGIWILDSGFDLGMDGADPRKRSIETWMLLMRYLSPPPGDELRTHTDLARLERGGVDAQFFSIWADPRGRGPGEYRTRAIEMIEALLGQFVRHAGRLTLAVSAQDIREAAAAGKIAGLMGLEGGHAIEDELENVENFYDLGIRYMTLTWSNTNGWADSSGDVRRHGGLTDFGREVVGEMNRLGMLVDVSHVSDETFWDVIEVTRAPVIASHSSARALVDVPRNLSDEMLRAVGENGGVVMVNFGGSFIDPAQGRPRKGRARHPPPPRALARPDGSTARSDRPRSPRRGHRSRRSRIRFRRHALHARGRTRCGWLPQHHRGPAGARLLRGPDPQDPGREPAARLRASRKRGGALADHALGLRRYARFRPHRNSHWPSSNLQCDLTHLIVSPDDRCVAESTRWESAVRPSGFARAALLAIAALETSCLQGPSLVIELLTVPHSVAPGEPFASQSRVCNRGDTHSDPASVAFALQPVAPAGSELAVGGHAIPPLPVGQCHTQESVFMAPSGQPDGSHRLVGRVTPGRLQGHASAVFGIGYLPDLEVEQLAGPPSVAPGGSFDVSGLLCNRGTAWASGANVSLYLSSDAQLVGTLGGDPSPDHPLGGAFVSGLAPGACLPFEVAASATVPADGLYQLGAIADEVGSVSELDESDNARLQGEIAVGWLPDLVVASLSAPNTTPPGALFELEGVVCNQGTRAEPAFSALAALQ